MHERPKCNCPLCRIDRKLRAELFDRANEDRQRVVFRSLPHLADFDTAAALFSHLQSSKANTATDVLLSELLAAKRRFPDHTAKSLLILVFLPVLHSTVRNVRRRYPALSQEDTVQQALGSLLEYLDSPRLQERQTYLAFAIARQVRRATFEWADREARSPLEGARSEPADGTYLVKSADEPFERAALLHHLLGRALRAGVLNCAELDLLVQFKLEGGAENGAFSNAERQRLKRLVAKLRTLANRPHHNRH
jgi:hypothetical protein